MSYNNISTEVTSAQKNDVIQKVKDIKNVLNFTVNLTNEERKNLRKMGKKRSSYVHEVHRTLEANPDILPKNFSQGEFSKDITLIDQLKEIESHLAPLSEAVSDTIIALGNEVMKQADTGYKYIKTASSGNQNLNSATAKISSYFKNSANEDSEGIIEDEPVSAPQLN